MLSSTTATIECQDLRKTLTDGARTLSIVVPALAVEPGQCAAIVGPNGDGKTTLLRLVGGAVAPDSGRLRVKRPLIAFTSPERQLHYRLNPVENVKYLTALFGHAVRDTSSILRALHQMGLGEHEAMPVSRLSKGQKTRLVLAMLSLGPWRTVLLDEPSNGLDQEGRDLLVRTLRELKARGAGVMITSHDRSLIASVADTIVHRDDKGDFAASPLAQESIEPLFEIRWADGTSEILRASQLGAATAGRTEAIASISSAGLAAE